MIASPTKIPGLLSISVTRHGDVRGFFEETYCHRAYARAGVEAVFVQDIRSITEYAGSVRGLKYQSPPNAQAKLVRCGSGSLFYVAVDIRVRSATYGHWQGEVLSFENGRQLYIPESFAHGFMTLEGDTEIVYKFSDFYAPECEGEVRFHDPGIVIEWPKINGCATTSEKDTRAPMLRYMRPPFSFEAAP